MKRVVADSTSSRMSITPKNYIEDCKEAKDSVDSITAKLSNELKQLISDISEYEKNMSIALTRILQRFHGAPSQIDDSCSREYMDILDMLLTQNNQDLLTKFLSFSGDFSTDVRKQIVEKLDKKIAQEEFSQGVHYD